MSPIHYLNKKKGELTTTNGELSLSGVSSPEYQIALKLSFCKLWYLLPGFLSMGGSLSQQAIDRAN
jgi:hypothetical protein